MDATIEDSFKAFLKNPPIEGSLKERSHAGSHLEFPYGFCEGVLPQRIPLRISLKNAPRKDGGSSTKSPPKSVMVLKGAHPSQRPKGAPPPQGP